MSNVLVVLQLLLQAGAQVTQLSQLLQTAQSEGRDITDAELDAVISAYGTAHASLDELIASKSATKTG